MKRAIDIRTYIWGRRAADCRPYGSTTRAIDNRPYVLGRRAADCHPCVSFTRAIDIRTYICGFAIRRTAAGRPYVSTKRAIDYRPTANWRTADGHWPPLHFLSPLSTLNSQLSKPYHSVYLDVHILFQFIV